MTLKKFSPNGKGEYAHLYKGPIWEGLRRATFARDALRCQICGAICAGRYPAPLSPVCDHITPHKGNPALFYAPDNLQTLCKLCHDSAKAKVESRGYSQAPDASGWPIDPRHPANRHR